MTFVFGARTVTHKLNHQTTLAGEKAGKVQIKKKPDVIGVPVRFSTPPATGNPLRSGDVINCSSCKQDKIASRDFNKNKSRKNGLQDKCRECSNKMTAHWRATHRERVSIYFKEYRQKNPEKCRLVMMSGKSKKRKTPSGKLSHNISVLIWQCLKRNKNKWHWEILVGYTLNQLKTHLEKQFNSSMSWDNYGPYWHIDHIIPIAAFNFTGPEDIDFKKCWALSNLRPLEALKNVKKCARLGKPFQPSLAFKIG